MAHNLMDLHAFGDLLSATPCLVGCYFLMGVGLWNMAATVAAEGLRANLLVDAPIRVRRRVIIPGEVQFYGRFEVSESTSPISLGSPEAMRLAVKRPHHEHFLAQKIA
jgi:hypothetical protein